MTRTQKISLFLLRVGMGWVFFYAGITKVLNPAWSAEGYLRGAKTFTGFYMWLASPAVLPYTNFLNAWGLTLLGVALLVGCVVRWASWAGIALMFLYWFPILVFPHPNPNSFLVDEHIMYALVLWVLGTYSAGKMWGLEEFYSQKI